MAVWENPDREVWQPPKEEEKAVAQDKETPYKPQGWGSVAGDIGRGAIAAPMEALRSIPGIFESLGEIGKAISRNVGQPIGQINPRVGMNLASGGLEFLKQILNQPGKAVEYLGEK